jgi:hypothetical protein
MIIECQTTTAEDVIITVLLRQGLHLGRDYFRTTLPDRNLSSMLRTRQLSAVSRPHSRLRCARPLARQSNVTSASAEGSKAA